MPSRTCESELAVYRSLWGHPGGPGEAVAAILAAGYDGVESPWPNDPAEQKSIAVESAEAGLGLIPLILLEGETASEQLRQLRNQLEEIAPYNPDRVVVHSGCDWWQEREAVDFYRQVVEIESEANLRCAHETHRGRPLNTPWATARILTAVPELRLCCDLSHWVLVGERLLEDQEDAIELAARHALHIHARVGTIEAPQVADPAAPEVAEELARFEAWWELIWRAQIEAGIERLTLTPEYGPHPYQPVADDPQKLAAICAWQAGRSRERFARTVAAL